MKYLAFTRIAFQQELQNRGALIGRIMFYAVILLVFSHVWMAMRAQPGFTGSDSTQMLWYLALTEWIILSVPLVHLDVERDVRSGDIAYLLCRPVSYLNMRLFEAFGTLLMRMLVFGVFGFLFTLFFSGSLPPRPLGLLFALPLGILAGIVNTVFLSVIGLSAFWLQDANPLSWVWQKLSFIFGGLIFPLSIYPEWLQAFSTWTPFYYLLFGPAQSGVNADPALALRALTGLLAWGLLAWILLLSFYGAGRKQLQVNGG